MYKMNEVGMTLVKFKCTFLTEPKRIEIGKNFQRKIHCMLLPNKLIDYESVSPIDYENIFFSFTYISNCCSSLSFLILSNKICVRL